LTADQIQFNTMMTARISTIVHICWLSISVSMISAFSPTSLLESNIRLSQQLFHHKITNDDRRTFLTSSSLFHHKISSYDRRTFCIASSSLVASTMISSSDSITNAITPEQASKSYDTYASTYDNLDGGSIASSLGIDEARQDLLSKASGNVLEIGVGTGLNLNSYNYNNIKSLTLVDISNGMIEEAKLRINEIDTKDTSIKFVIADATSELTSLFGEETFDTVVDTFSLCVMGNEGAKRCLDQMTSVVKKKTGQIFLIENTRSSNPVLGAYQDITASAAAQMGGKGCLYNQDVGKMIRQTKGLQLVKEEAFAGGVFRSFVCQHI